MCVCVCVSLCVKAPDKQVMAFLWRIKVDEAAKWGVGKTRQESLREKWEWHCKRQQRQMSADTAGARPLPRWWKHSPVLHLRKRLKKGEENRVKRSERGRGAKQKEGKQKRRAEEVENNGLIPSA